VRSVRQRWVLAPGWRMPLQVLRAATVVRDREVFTLRPGQTIQAVRVDPVVPDRVAPAALTVPVGRVAQGGPAGRVDPANTAQVVPVDLPVGPVARVDPVVPDPAVPAARADLDTQAVPASTGPVDRADPVVRVALADRVDPVVLGTAIRIAAISTTRRGATDPDLGDRASRLDRRGIDRFRRPEARGTTARSTTGATRRPPCGIPVSTPGASGSSESGFRCK
jgi:hypothetical protein